MFNSQPSVIAADHQNKAEDHLATDHKHHETADNNTLSHDVHKHLEAKHTHVHQEHESHNHKHLSNQPLEAKHEHAENKPHSHDHNSIDHAKIKPTQQQDFIEHQHRHEEDEIHQHKSVDPKKNEDKQFLGFIEHEHVNEESENQGHQHKQDDDKKNQHIEYEHKHEKHGHEKHDHEQEKNDHADSHEGHEEAELKFSTAELEEFSIILDQVKPGIINKTLDLTGEVIVAPEHLHHVVPGVSGVVRQLFKHLGDSVKTGDLLATLSSGDLADAKAQYVAANSLLQLANARLKREHDLYKNKVTAKRNYLAARQAYTEISIKHKAAKQQLLSIGLTEKAIFSVLRNTDKDLTLYELRAPADGIIIEKHAAIGEVLETDTRSYTLADLSKVWINLTVYQKDLPYIHQGQQVLLYTRFSSSETKSSSPNTINWVSPILDESTRSATARVIIDNTDGQWRPGLFVSGKVNISSTEANIVVPLSALQTLKGQTVVFIQHSEGEFEPQIIQIGQKDHQQVEVLKGLTIGQTYVSKNSFSLKAQLQKDSFGHGHSH